MSVAMAYGTANRLAPIATTGIRADLALSRQAVPQGVLGFLPDQDWRALMQWATARPVPRRHAIFTEGNPGSAVYLVLEGYVKLSTMIADGREKLPCRPFVPA